MATEEVTINGNTVWRDDALTHRWFDAIGPDACVMTEDFVNTPFSAADQMAAWLATLVEAGADESTASLVAGSAGGELLLSNDANDDDGLNVQLLGEAYYFGSRYPTYFGCKFKISDATQMDAVAGLIITDATIVAGCSDGLYFRKPDGETTLYLVAEKDSLETVIGVHTMIADTYVEAEYLYYGGVVYVYINRVQVAELADSDPNFPDDEYLTPSLCSQNGEAAAKDMWVDWINAIQIQAT